MIEKEDSIISEEEAAQYDRQIRLWGLDAQKRLRGSRVLLVGLQGLGAEVAKNLILAGVKGLTLLDHEQVCLTGCPRDLMVRIDQVCAQKNVKVFCGDVFGYHGYMFSNLGPEHHFVEEKAKVVKPSEDANDRPEAKKPRVDPTETTMVKKTASFCSLKEALEIDWTNEKAKAGLKRTPADYFLLQVLLKFRTDKGRDPHPGTFAEDSSLLQQIRDDVLEAQGLGSELLSDNFVSHCFSEMAPVCAVVGGVLAQEIVKALSQRDPPHRNFFFFDGSKGSGVVDYFGAK
uniref:SUMO1 activating enzyme subunit 1 n=1 Tax=Paramormyrops kingsleyae TaxID=1676925 RepID=A0A3B3RYK9_9TELE